MGSCFVHGPQLVYPCADDSVVAVRRWAGVDNKAAVGFFCCPQSSFPFKDLSRRECAHQHIVGSSGWSINVFIIDSTYIYIYIYQDCATSRGLCCGNDPCFAEQPNAVERMQDPSNVLEHQYESWTYTCASTEDGSVCTNAAWSPRKTNGPIAVGSGGGYGGANSCLGPWCM